MSALTDDQPQFKPVAGWALPNERGAFLDWLKVAIPHEPDDAARYARFRTYPAYQQMPVELADALKDLVG